MPAVLAEGGEKPCSSSSKSKGGKKLSTVSASDGGLGIGDAMVGGKTLFIIELSWLRTVRKEVDEEDSEPVEDCAACVGLRRGAGVKQGGLI